MKPDENKDLRELFESSAEPEQPEGVIHGDELIREAIRSGVLPDELRPKAVTRSERMQLLVSKQTKARLTEAAKDLKVSQNELANRALRTWLKLYEIVKHGR